MAFVDGVVLDSPEMSPTPAIAEQATGLLVDTLVALHSVDPGSVGLADFGWTENFLERQLRRWHQQFESWAGSNETEQRVVAALLGGLPASGESSIVHGDYRLTNVLFSHDLAQIKAVVDWEMATLGDPLTDVGLLYCYHSLSGISSVMPDFAAADGFLSADAMIARYATATGGDLSALDWYVAFGYLKLSVIAAGIHTRFQHGDTVGDGFEEFGGLIQQTLDAASSQLGGI
jgi:aminoglycoside phosphotransferase (APT) family kinase protein